MAQVIEHQKENQIFGEQKVAIHKLEKLMKNHIKAKKADRAKPEYYMRRIKRLDNWWAAFEVRHKSLDTCLTIDLTEPYFADDLFTSTRDLYQQHRQDLQDGLTKVAPPGYTVPIDIIDIGSESEDEDASKDKDDHLLPTPQAINAMLESALKDFITESTSWDAIVSHVLIKKLSKETIKHYECQLNDVRNHQLWRNF